MRSKLKKLLLELLMILYLFITLLPITTINTLK